MAYEVMSDVQSNQDGHDAPHAGIFLSPFAHVIQKIHRFSTMFPPASAATLPHSDVRDRQLLSVPDRSENKEPKILSQVPNIPDVGVMPTRSFVSY